MEESTPRPPARDAGIPTSFVISFIVLTVIFTFAVTLPEYYKFQMHEKRLKLVEEYLNKVESQSTSSSIQQTQTQPMTLGPTNATNSVIKDVLVPQLSFDPSELFESYSRFITLLVGLISVLGLFFGYFVRKSIKETEDEMENRLNRGLQRRDEEFVTETKRIEELEKQLTEKLGSLEAVEKKLTEKLGVLEAAAKQYEQKPTETMTAAENIVAAARNVDDSIQE